MECLGFLYSHTGRTCRVQEGKELIDFQGNPPILEILTNLLEFRLQIPLHSLNLEIPERRVEQLFIIKR